MFAHPNAPETGIQVPGGTVEEGEDPAAAVLREAQEETGLRRLELHAFLGECDFTVPASGQIQRRRFYHVLCPGRPPERWRHLELNPSDGTLEPIPFEFYWVRLPAGVPELAPGHGAMLPRLMRAMRMRNP